jgi:hypothetical protein
VFTHVADKPTVAATYEFDAARIVYSSQRAYVLVRRAAPMLSAVDLTSDKAVFSVAAPTMNQIDLEVVSGVPDVRMREGLRSYANVYHPETGKRVYSDGRDQDAQHKAF